ncbi:MAG: Lrp/AsnC family transcriptional regulator [Sulfuriferula sp.]
MMDDLDRMIVNSLQGGFPVCDHPFAAVAEQLGTTEEEILTRIDNLLRTGTLSRFGPMYNAEQMGGAFSLAAMMVPEPDFDQIAEIVNGYPQVAHNYRREHALNMWFVLATETPDGIDRAIGAIEERTGLKVYNFPKIEEFCIGLRFDI